MGACFRDYGLHDLGFGAPDPVRTGVKDDPGDGLPEDLSASGPSQARKDRPPPRRLRVDGAGTGSRLQAGAAPRTIDDEHSERVQADARSPAMILLCNANPNPDEIFGKDSRHQRRSRPDAADASAR